MTPKDLGNRLKTARRAKKWRTRDLHRLTKINEDYIKDFEDGKFNILPKPYIRAFLRTLSTTLGLNPDEILEDFEEIMNPPEVFGEREVEAKKQEDRKPQKRKAKAESKEESVKKKEAALAPEAEKKSPKAKSGSKEKSASAPEAATLAETGVARKSHKTETLLVALVLLLLVVTGYAYWKFGRSHFVTKEEPVKEITVFEARKEILQKETKKTPPVPKSTETKAAAPAAAQKVTLALLARDTTWVRVIRDKADTSEFMFYPGNKRQFRADSLLQLKMGRADGLLLWVNGDSVGALGTASQVVSRLIVGRKGIQVKKLRGPKPQPKQE